MNKSWLRLVPSVMTREKRLYETLWQANGRHEQIPHDQTPKKKQREQKKDVVVRVLVHVCMIEFTQRA